MNPIRIDPDDSTVMMSVEQIITLEFDPEKILEATSPHPPEISSRVCRIQADTEPPPPGYIWEVLGFRLKIPFEVDSRYFRLESLHLNGTANLLQKLDPELYAQRGLFHLFDQPVPQLKPCTWNLSPTPWNSGTTEHKNHRLRSPCVAYLSFFLNKPLPAPFRAYLILKALAQVPIEDMDTK